MSIYTTLHLAFLSNSHITLIATNHTLTLCRENDGTNSTGDNGQATLAEIGYPGSIAIDASGNVYFADLYNFVIREITPDHIIHPVTIISDLNASTIAVAVDTSGSLFYVTGTRNVFKFAGGPTLVATVAAPSDASYFAIDRNGALYVSSRVTQRLLKLSCGHTSVIAGAYPYDVDPLPRAATVLPLQLPPFAAGVAVHRAEHYYLS